jgi:hypothetical protein
MRFTVFIIENKQDQLNVYSARSAQEGVEPALDADGR